MSTFAGPKLGTRPLPTSVSTTLPPIASPEPPTRLGVKLLAIYIFLLTGRALDVSPIWFLHIPMIMLILLMIMTVAGGDLKRAMSSSISKYFAAFTVWVVLCFPFSYWRAGSLPSVQWQLQSFAIFLIIVQMVKSVEDWQKIAVAYAYATATAALLSFYMGVSIQGRVALPGGTLGDPNEFALTMVVGLPFWWFKASRATGFKKIAFLLATVPMYAAFARAGSRSGLIALAMLFVIAFTFAKGNQKVIIAVGAMIAIAAASVLLPDYLKARYMTFFSHSGDYDSATKSRLGADIASSEERRELLIQSLKMTFSHPIFGVGPGDFLYVSWDERKAARGVGGESLVSHNTYTQISSETGLPGFFVFAATVALSLRYAYRTYRESTESDPPLMACARYLLYSSGALFAGIFFLSVGYTHILGTLFALATSIRLIAETRAFAATVRNPELQRPVSPLPVTRRPGVHLGTPPRPQRPRPRRFRQRLATGYLAKRPSV
ncbi:MAG: O-antigen ligase family protein [Bryobacteraceae bacterium]